jgi:hypothetical protein
MRYALLVGNPSGDLVATQSFRTGLWKERDSKGTYGWLC